MGNLTHAWENNNLVFQAIFPKTEAIYSLSYGILLKAIYASNLSNYRSCCNFDICGFDQGNNQYSLPGF